MAADDRAIQSFEVHGSAQRRDQSLVSLNPPPPPDALSVFNVVLRKHIFVARRRKRLLTVIWPALIYSAVDIAMWYAFAGIDETTMKTQIFAVIAPVYLNLALIACLQCVIVEVVSEKESKMKIIQQIYGLTPALYWLTWIGYFTAVALLAIVGVLLIFSAAAPILRRANLFLVGVMFVAAYVQQFQVGAIVAVFFDKVTTASGAANAIGLVFTFASAGIQGFLRGKAQIIWYAVGLFPSVSFFQGFATTLWLETHYVCDASMRVCSRGLSMRTLFAEEVCPQPQIPCGAPVEVFPAGASLLLLLIGVGAYGFLAWWLDNVWQGEYGAAKPLLFCLDPSFMCPRRRTLEVRGGSPLLATEGQAVTMSISHLRKVFGQRVAVDDLSLEFYSREIFALLGHNGAGKTTAINCVIGLVPPTGGEASVNGFDVRVDVEGARRQLSLCPQDNPVYDVFTVRQHLTFFANLRGVPAASVPERIERVLMALGIPEKIDELCTSLSGGQKRRLWVATALLGETPVVFLDEPTSGMDPSSRRELWDLLLQMRTAGRTIIFTTHYLEEADVLADRKAVLARGKVQAVGTSRDLKMQFGVGYHLTLLLKNDSAMDALKSLVETQIPSAKEREVAEEEVVEGEVQFVLPYAEVSKIGPLLLEVDARKEELNVKDYSVAMTSLGEIFMNLGRMAEAARGDARSNADFREVEQEAEGATTRQEVSFSRSTLAMARMRAEVMINDKKNIYNTVIVPCALVVLAFYTGQGGINIAIYPPTAFALSTIFFTVHAIRDRQLKCKHTAIAQGLQPAHYWLGTAIANYLSVIPVTLCLAAMVVVKTPVGVPDAGLLLIFVMTFVYPISLVLYSYNFSMLFDTVEVAMKVIPLFNFFLGMAPTILISVLIELDTSDDVAGWLHLAMSFLNPLYGLPGTMVMLMHTNSTTILECFTSLPALPLYTSFVLDAFLVGNLVHQDRRSRTARPGAASAGGTELKDDDVLAEEERVMSSESTGEAVRYVNLMHTYRTKTNGRWQETPAVRGISLGIQAGECFGLLGPNGAGKTTTLAALTSEVRPPSAGRLLVCGYDIAQPAGLDAAYQRLGVCPQVDPLWGRLSGRQHLTFYGRVKGVPEEDLQSTCEALLFRLGFDSVDFDKMAEEYSGGMKRKLSLACALIGYSELLFLDEPSAAVDAGAKRHLWKVIKRRRRGQTVVITTHSMEEAEALCGRIAVQVKGQLRCLGSPMQIKQKYGSGYQLEIFGETSRAPEEEDGVVRFVKASITEEAKLIERHAGRYLFQLPPMGAESKLSLGRVFSEMSSGGTRMGVSDFSINQPSLEQVFIRFAREQYE